MSHDVVTVTLDDPGDDTITGYVILRRDKDVQSQGTFVTLAPDTRSTATTYVDVSVDPERRYVYRIKAVNAHGRSTISSWLRADTAAAPSPDTNPDPAPDPDPVPDTNPDPALDPDPVPDTNSDPDPVPDTNSDDADQTATTFSPPPKAPEWIRDFAVSYAHSSGGGGLATPTRFQAKIKTSTSLVFLSWDGDAAADGYEVYVPATRTVSGTERDWWVHPGDEDEPDDQLTQITDPIGGSGRQEATLLGFRAGVGDTASLDTASFLKGYLFLAVSAHRDTVRPDANPACRGIDPTFPAMIAKKSSTASGRTGEARSSSM